MNSKLIKKFQNGGITLNDDNLLAWNAPVALDANGYLYTIGNSGYIPTVETARHYEPNEASTSWNNNRSSNYPMDTITVRYPAGTSFRRRNDGTFEVSEQPAAEAESFLEGNTSGNGNITSGALTYYAELEPTRLYNMADLDSKVLFRLQDPITQGAQDDSFSMKVDVLNPELLDVTQAFKQKATGKECLQQSAAWDVDYLAPIFGYTPLGKLYENVNTSYGVGKKYNLESGDVNGEKVYNDSVDSWELPYVLRDIGAALLINLPEEGEIDFTQFPIGTVFSTGSNYNGYLKYPEAKDEYGKTYPSHTYILGGLTTDSEGVVTPLFMDYHHVVADGTSPNIYSRNPKYALIPKGREELTAANLMPLYQQYIDGMDNASLENVVLNDNNKVNEEIRKIDPRLIYKISKKYGVPMDETFRRLLAIGELESKLGDSLKYKTKEFIENLFGDWTAKVAKGIGSLLIHGDPEMTGIHTVYDTVPGWKHEVDIFNRLKESGELEGKTDEEIRRLVANAYNEEAKANLIIDYGKMEAPTNFDVSRGWFLMKPDAYTDSIYDRIAKLTGQSYDSSMARAYHRLAYLCSEIHKKYPELSESQVLDAATIAWNALSKINSPEFIEHYIKNNILKDYYLDVVKGHESALYNKLGGILRAKKGILIKKLNRGKFTETKKRTGKTTEELTHSKNPLTRKRAVFAQNAKKWSNKHFLGGSFLGLATDNNLMVSKDKQVSTSKPKHKLVKKHNN